MADGLVSPSVPVPWKKSYSPSFASFNMRRRTSLALLILGMGTWALPLTTTALSFLEPMTAPTPERPAARPLSFMMQEMRESFSPACPMDATCVPLPWRSIRMSSVSLLSRPQRSDASCSDASPSSISRYVGFSAMPVNSSPSYPANFMCGPNVPPQLASPQVPVSGDLHTATKRLPSMQGVPVIGPVSRPRMLSGPRASTFGFIRS